ncbi:MAG: hypothetical protein SGILL_007947 [Bacillariaceae sp.]
MANTNTSNLSSALRFHIAKKNPVSKKAAGAKRVPPPIRTNQDSFRAAAAVTPVQKKPPDSNESSRLHEFILKREFSNAVTRATNRATLDREAFIKDADGNTALHLLVKVHLDRKKKREVPYYEDLLSVLLQVNPKAGLVTNKEGQTPLHLACANPSPDLSTIATLMNHSYEATEVKDTNGKLPRDLACYPSVVAALEGKAPSAASVPVSQQPDRNLNDPHQPPPPMPPNAGTPEDIKADTKPVKMESRCGTLDMCYCVEGCNCNQFFFGRIKDNLTKSEASGMNKFLNNAVKHTLKQKRFSKTLHKLENQGQQKTPISRSSFNIAMKGFAASCHFSDKILTICSHEGHCYDCNRNHPIFKIKTDWKEENQNASVAKLNAATRSTTNLGDLIRPTDTQERFRKAMEAALFQGDKVVTSERQNQELKSQLQKLQEENASLKAKVELDENQHASEMSIVVRERQEAVEANANLEKEKELQETNLQMKDKELANQKLLLDQGTKYIKTFTEERMMWANLKHINSPPQDIVKVFFDGFTDVASFVDHHNESPETILVMIEKTLSLLENSRERIWRKKEALLAQLEALVSMLVENCKGDETKYQHLRSVGLAMLAYLSHQPAELYPVESRALKEDSDIKLLPHIPHQLLQKINQKHRASQGLDAARVVSMQLPRGHVCSPPVRSSNSHVAVSSENQAASQKHPGTDGEKKNRKRPVGMTAVKTEAQESQLPPAKKSKPGASRSDPIVLF